MKTYLECIPCFVAQTLRAGRLATSDEYILKELLDEVGGMIKSIPLDSTPVEIASGIYKKIREITGVLDVFKEKKHQHIQEALLLLPQMRERVLRSADPLLTAIRMAIAGNVIDLGMSKEFDMVHDIEIILHQDFALFDYDLFKHELNKTDNILYLGDNAGESVFDRLLIEQLKKPVIYAVRGVPIINDVTMDDAVDSGLDQVAQIISSGTPAPGTILSLCNESFVEQFNKTGLIISKGQGNYEGLSTTSKLVFFLLKAKCPVIAKDLGVKEDDIVLKASSRTL